MSSKNTITIRHSLFVNRPPSVVWDFTQNYEHRMKWDSSVLGAEVLATIPNRIVKLKTRGNTMLVFQYKLDDRPHKTTLAIQEAMSPIIESGGGSWSYEEKDGGTWWTQTNTISFKKNVLLPVLLPFYQWMFERQTRGAMNKAKSLMERNNESY